MHPKPTRSRCPNSGFARYAFSAEMRSRYFNVIETKFLRASSMSEFSHRLGQSSRFGDVRAASFVTCGDVPFSHCRANSIRYPNTNGEMMRQPRRNVIVAGMLGGLLFLIPRTDGHALAAT
jgi:hypothetical protein